MSTKLDPKPPQGKRLEPSNVKEVSSGSGVSFGAAKVVIDKAFGLIHEIKPRKKPDKTPAGV